MIRQLRPFYTPGKLAQVYAESYDSSKWPDHILRVEHTARLLKAMDPASVADLSCGDGKVVSLAGLDCPVYLGDYCDGWPLTGPIEDTIIDIPPVDVFVLSETLEHVERPLLLLDAIRDKADRLLLSTPCGEDNDQNPQHYWGWDIEDIRGLLKMSMWTPIEEPELYIAPCAVHYYTFQIWRCQ